MSREIRLTLRPVAAASVETRRRRSSAAASRPSTSSALSPMPCFASIRASSSRVSRRWVSSRPIQASAVGFDQRDSPSSPTT
jgi:hypothetical protein